MHPSLTLEKRIASEYRKSAKNPADSLDQLFSLGASDYDSLCIYTVQLSVVRPVLRRSRLLQFPDSHEGFRSSERTISQIKNTVRNHQYH